MKQLLLLSLLLSEIAFGVTANKVWRVPSGGTLPEWGTVNLADGTNAVTGILALGNLAAEVPHTYTGTSLNIVTGKVAANGSVSSGTGFSSVKNATGDYTITYTSAFSVAPYFIGTVEFNSNNGCITIHTSAVGSTRYLTWNCAGTQVDHILHFIAIGSR